MSNWVKIYILKSVIIIIIIKIVEAAKNDLKTAPSISGSNYGKTFELLQWHLHWGYNIYQGSEHLIDNVKYPLELHLVHRSTDGKFAVVGFMFEVTSSDNALLEPMLASIKEVGDKTGTFILL